MNSKKGLSRVMSALLAASSMIGGASAAPKKKVRRPNSAGVVIDGGSSKRGRKRLAGRPRAKSAPPFLKNSKTYYLGIPGLIGTAGIGYGLYHLLSKGEKKKEEDKKEEDKKEEDKKEEDKKEEDKKEEDKKEDKAGEKSGEGSSLDFVEEEDIKKLSECGLIDYLESFKFKGFSNRFSKKINWNSFGDGDDGNRKFDFVDFSIKVGDESNPEAYISRFNFDVVNSCLNPLDLGKDNGKTKSNALQVDFRLKGMGTLFFLCDSKKSPIENYAHAIAEAAFFCRFCFTYGGGWPGKEYCLKKYKNCLSFIKEERSKYYGDDEDKVLKLFEGCKILEKYLCEVLKNEEENMQSAKK